MKPTTSNEIRQAFLDFFEEMGHQVVPSSPLPDFENPTLLFTNAGMNQFANTFLGREDRPYRRAVTAQKCMRVQGKHNDLENVGPSPRHHTFFEMLGNFSFGDYYKAGAIRYAYDFMTRVCQIPAERLWFTVHHQDDDAYRIWVQEIGVDPARVLRMGDKTNFWMMGDVGPCGPTSEIHYDWGPEYDTCGDPNCSVMLDNDCGRWLEVWNLVFMQYNQDEDGVRTLLPKPGVDTGMGLERITAVVQQKPVNYDTDLFAPVMDRLQQMLGDDAAAREAHTVGYRVIADHGRAATFLIGDGVLPGNVGRGYVLRMIIRRAARFGRSIGFERPFLSQVADSYIDLMGETYPELQAQRDAVKHTLQLEEERFARTVGEALDHLDALLASLSADGQSEIPGEVAFNLYATYGLPLEITRDVAVERGFTIDEPSYFAAREAHAAASGAGAFGRYETGNNVYADLLADLVAQGMLDQSGVDYDPYGGSHLASTVLGLVRDGVRVTEAAGGESVEVITAGTPFYVAAGGEVSDTGEIRLPASGAVVRIDDVRAPIAGLLVHAGQVVKGKVRPGDAAELAVDDERRWDIRRNHTATHLLHRELRAKLGSHVTQQGSLVAPDRLRFDFSHGEPVGDDTLAEIEAAINEAVLANRPVVVAHVPRKEAVGEGAMALFGEKYGDVVRTIKIGDADRPYSYELCGGLHVSATGDIGPFHFTSEEAVGAGLRRVEAVTGRGALALVHERLAALNRVAGQLNTTPAEVEARLEQLAADHRALQREVAQLRRGQARANFEALLDQMRLVQGVPVMTGIVDGVDMDGLREMADWFRDRVPSGVAALAGVRDGRPILVVAVSDDLVGRGVKASDLIGKIAPYVGGGGGGRPTLAQAGGKDARRLDEALAAVPELVASALAA